MQGGSIVGLGYASTARFVNDRRFGIEYLGNKDNTSSTVNLICVATVKEMSQGSE